MTVFLDLSGNEYIAQTNFKVTHGVNGELSISGEIISNDDVLHGIDRGWRLKFKDEYFYITYQKLQDEGRNTSVVFDAVHQFFWDFSKSPVYQKLSSTTSFRNCLEFIFKDSGYRYYVDQTIETASFTKENFGMKDRLSLFNELVSSAGVEFNVSGKVVSIYKEVGTNLSTVVRKKLNLNELSITRNIGELITCQRGFGKWKDENDHSKGRLEVEYESPLAKVYGRLEGQPVEDERYSIASSLLAVLKKNVDSSYSLSIELSMEDLTSAGYPNAQPHEGDYIMVVDEDRGFRERVRIISYTSSYDVRENLIDHQVTCNDIGAVKKQSAGYRSLVNQVKSTDANLANVQATANKALVSADGKSTNYYGTNFPVDVPNGTLKKGDLFYQQVGDKTIMHVWNGYEWVADPVVNELGALEEHVRTEFEKVSAELNQQELDHNQAVADLLAKAGAAESLAQEAKNIGNQAKTDAVNAINGALEAKQLAQAAGGQISQVQLAVDEANRQILQRVTKAEINPITQRLSSAEATILTQAGQIEQRLTSTQVESAITGKGYITSSALQPYALSTTVQNLVNETADSFSRTISETKALIPTSIGGRNLIRGSTEMVIGSGTWDSGTFRKSGIGTIKTINVSNSPVPNVTKGIEVEIASAVECGIAQDALFLPKGTYTFSVWVYGPTGANGRIDTFNGSGSKSKVFRLTGGWDKITVTNTSTVDETKTISYIYLQNSPGYPAKMHIVAPKLETGSIPSDYTPAIEDLTTVTAFNSTKDTVDSHTRTIGAVGTSGSILDNVSQVTQTAAGLVSRVSLITDAQNLVYDPTRYSKYVARNSTSNLQKANYSQYSAMRINHSGLTTDTYSGFKMPLRTSTFTAGEKLSIRAVIGIDALPDAGGQIKFEIKNQGTIVAYFWLQPTRTGNDQVFTATTTVNVSTATVDEYGLDVLINRNGNVNITQISIVRGERVPTSFVDSTTSQDLAISTQVSQLADSYAIKTLNAAGDVLSAVNVATGGVALQAGQNKLVVTPQTTFIQDGTIQSAMIASLDAGKIVTGTLDASKANVINLNASNIVSGTMTANRISGGTLTALNNTTNFNLQTGWFDMNAEAVGIRNLFPNYPIQYLIFGRGAINSKEASYTALMSNSKRAVGMNDGSAGIQIWNAMDNTTAVNLYGDEIVMMYNANDPKGIVFNNVNNTIGNIDNIYLSGYGNYNLVSLLNNIYENLRLLHNNKTTATGYNYTLFGPK